MITRPKRKTVTLMVDEELIARVDTEAERLYRKRADILRLMLHLGGELVLAQLAQQEDVPEHERF